MQRSGSQPPPTEGRAALPKPHHMALPEPEPEPEREPEPGPTGPAVFTALSYRRPQYRAFVRRQGGQMTTTSSTLDRVLLGRAFAAMEEAYARWKEEENCGVDAEDGSFMEAYMGSLCPRERAQLAAAVEALQGQGGQGTAAADAADDESEWELLRDCEIHDARPLQADLETQGFCLVPHVSAVTDWRDEQVVRKTYFPELERLVSQLTGASHVFVEQHVLREEEGGGDEAAQRPIRLVVRPCPPDALPFPCPSEQQACAAQRFHRALQVRAAVELPRRGWHPHLPLMVHHRRLRPRPRHPGRQPPRDAQLLAKHRPGARRERCACGVRHADGQPG